MLRARCGSKTYCVCSVIDQDFRRNIVKVAVDPRSNCLVDPQTRLPQWRKGRDSLPAWVTHRVSQENGVLFPCKNSLLTKLVRSRWLDIGLILVLCAFMDLDSVSVRKRSSHLDQSSLVHNPCILRSHARKTNC